MYRRRLCTECNKADQRERSVRNSSHQQTEGVKESRKGERKTRKEAVVVQEWWIRLCPLCTSDTGKQIEEHVPEGSSKEWLQSQGRGESQHVIEKSTTKNRTPSNQEDAKGEIASYAPQVQVTAAMRASHTKLIVWEVVRKRTFTKENQLTTDTPEARSIRTTCRNVTSKTQHYGDIAEISTAAECKNSR